MERFKIFFGDLSGTPPWGDKSRKSLKRVTPRNDQTRISRFL